MMVNKISRLRAVGFEVSSIMVDYNPSSNSSTEYEINLSGKTYNNHHDPYSSPHLRFPFLSRSS